MSTARPPARPLARPAATPAPGPPLEGAKLYTVLALVALLTTAVPLLLRGMGLWSLFPSMVGALGVLLRWRAGPVLALFALIWMSLGDKIGVTPWGMIEWVLTALVSLFARARADLPRDLGPGHMQSPSAILDLLLCMTFVFYTIVHLRLVSVVGNIFPVDRRKRGPSPTEGKKGPQFMGPLIRQKRSEDLVTPQELPVMAIVSVAVAAGTLIFFLWLQRRNMSGDLWELIRLLRVVIDDVYDGWWRLFVVLWVFFVVLIVASGVIAYLGYRKLTPEESRLLLQDQLWRETRREQARSMRWLAWAQQQERQRRARRDRRDKP